MSREGQRYDRVESYLTRRRAILGGATLLTAGGTVLWTSDDANATVTVEEFSAESAEFQAEEVSPVVSATIGYDYDVGTAVVSAVRVRLLIDGTAVAEEELRTDRTTLSGETDLSAPVVDSDAWAVSDFDPDVAESVAREVTVTVEFAVLDDTESALVSDTASDTAQLTVTHPQESEFVATVDGTATFGTGN